MGEGEKPGGSKSERGKGRKEEGETEGEKNGGKEVECE